MLVEYLTFAVPSVEREQWIEVEGEVWTPFLERQPGFVSKQVWCERGDDAHVHVAVWWTDEASWKSIPQAELDAVEAAMGRWRTDESVRVFEVARAAGRFSEPGST